MPASSLAHGSAPEERRVTVYRRAYDALLAIPWGLDSRRTESEHLLVESVVGFLEEPPNDIGQKSANRMARHVSAVASATPEALNDALVTLV